jgi:hypothetical protein
MERVPACVFSSFHVCVQNGSPAKLWKVYRNNNGRLKESEVLAGFGEDFYVLAIKTARKKLF